MIEEDSMVMLGIHVGQDTLRRLVDERRCTKVYFRRCPSSAAKVGHSSLAGSFDGKS
jgi:hypothetical protein